MRWPAQAGLEQRCFYTARMHPLWIYGKTRKDADECILGRVNRPPPSAKRTHRDGNDEHRPTPKASYRGCSPANGPCTKNRWVERGLFASDECQPRAPLRCQGQVSGGDCDLRGERKAGAARWTLGTHYATFYSFTFFPHEYSITYVKEKIIMCSLNYDFRNLATI